MGLDRVADAEDELLDLLYGAGCGLNGWSDFLVALNTLIGNGKTTLLVHEAERNSGFLPCSAGFTAQETADYASYYGSINPWMEKAAVRPVGTGVPSDAMYDPRALTKTEFYNDFLRPNDLAGGIGVTIERHEDRSFILSTLMSACDEERSAALARLYTRLSPHLKRAFDLYQRRVTSPAHLPAIDLLENTEVGMIGICRSRQIVFRNGAAERLLTESADIRISPTGKLVLRCEAVSFAVSELLRPEAERKWFAWQARIGRRIFECTALRVEREAVADALAGPSVVLMLVPKDRAPERLLEGLTPRERSVAQAILDGASIAEIASRDNVSRETVRSQLKSAYLKLDITGQVDLVRLFR